MPAAIPAAAEGTFAILPLHSFSALQMLRRYPINALPGLTASPESGGTGRGRSRFGK